MQRESERVRRGPKYKKIPKSTSQTSLLPCGLSSCAVDARPLLASPVAAMTDFLARLHDAERRDESRTSSASGSRATSQSNSRASSKSSSPSNDASSKKENQRSNKRTSTPSKQNGGPPAKKEKALPGTGPAAPKAKAPSTKQLQEFGFKVLGPIAAGAFSTIVKAQHIESGTDVAVKTFARCAPGTPEAEEHERELRILRMISETHHAHIANMMAEYEAPNGGGTHAMLCYCGGGSLHAHLQKLRKKQMAMGEENAVICVAQVASALKFLHSVGVAHRDIKPANVLHDGRRWRLCDFGFAVEHEDKPLKKACGTLAYSSPEILVAIGGTSEGYLGPPVDMWALGCMIYEMRVGRECFVAPDLESLKLRIKNGFKGGSSGHPWLPHMKKERALISALLQTEPRKRLTPDQVLNSKWVTTHCEPTVEAKVVKKAPSAEVAWWCDAAGDGCLRPSQPTHEGQYDAGHRCWANNELASASYMLCEVCYNSGRAQTSDALAQVSGPPLPSEAPAPPVAAVAPAATAVDADAADAGAAGEAAAAGDGALQAASEAVDPAAAAAAAEAAARQKALELDLYALKEKHGAESRLEACLMEIDEQKRELMSVKEQLELSNRELAELKMQATVAP